MAEKLKKKRKNRWWKGLLIFLVTIVAIVGIPVGLVYALFYNDNFQNDFEPSTETMNDVFGRVMTSCLDETVLKEEINFKLSEDDFNQLLVPVVEQNLVPEAQQFINGFYLDITEDSYDFVIELKENYLNAFKTKIVLKTELKHVEATETAPDMLVFEITNLKVGNLDNMLSLGKTILNTFGADAFIQDFFEMSGLNIQVDLANNRLFYETDVLIQDMMSMTTGLDNEFLTIFQSVIDICVENDSFGFEFYEDETLKVYLKLTDFGQNVLFCNDDYHHEVDMDVKVYVDKCLTLIQEGIITETDANTLLHYLIHGYADTDSTNQAFVQGLDLTSIGITDNEAYEGFEFPDGDSLTDEATGQIKNSNFLVTGHLASISESFLNDMLSSTSIIGYSFLLNGHDKDGNSKLAFTTIDKFYINIVDNKLSAVARLNINGFYSYLIFDYVRDVRNTDENKIILMPAEIYFGNITAPESMVEIFYTIIGEAFVGLDGTSFDDTNGVITIDFSAALDQSGKLGDITSTGHAKISLLGEDLNSNGEVSLDFTKNS